MKSIHRAMDSVSRFCGVYRPLPLHTFFLQLETLFSKPQWPPEQDSVPSLTDDLETLFSKPQWPPEQDSVPSLTDDVVAGIRLPSLIAQQLRDLCANPHSNPGIDSTITQLLLVAEDCEEKRHQPSELRTSSHRFAARYPRLPLQSSPTLEPHINTRFCDMLMCGVLEQFNAWSRQSGFHEAAMRKLFDGEERYYPRRHGQVDVLYRSVISGQWNDSVAGITVRSEARFSDCIVLGVRDRQSDFQRYGYGTTIGTAVSMLDELMKEWKSETDLNG